MKKFKKIFLVFTIMFTIGALVACSSTSLNDVQKNFEAEGYNTYEYKNNIAANFDPTLENQPTDQTSSNAMFIPVDRMSIEIKGFLLDETNAKGLTAITDMKYDVYVMAKFELPKDEPQINKTAVIIEFPSAEYLQEVLRVSETIKTQLTGKVVEDHVRGNLLLLVRTVDFYDEIVDIFNQGES